MANTTVRVDGLKGLEKALGELGKRTGKATLRRAGKAGLVPFVNKASALAPKRTRELAESISVSTRLSKRQQKEQRRARAGKFAVNMFAGATALPHAHLVEFGTIHMDPQPFMRPAWASKKDDVLAKIASELSEQIRKAAARAERKAARQRAKGS